MQEPIRYYITKSGDEPTVRSVRVALGTDEPSVEPEAGSIPSESTTVSRQTPPPAAAVTRRVRDAIRRKSVER